MSKRILIYLGLLAVTLYGCGAQMPKDPKTIAREKDLSQLRNYFFINLNADTLYDPSGSLDQFYNTLQQLDTANSSQFIQLPIIHFGDSHIQAGYLTEVVRRRLQHEFGNAGRGFITPLKLAGTNEPRDYSITSPDTYNSVKILDRSTQKNAPGVSGLSIYNNSPRQRFKISLFTVPEDSLNYSFSKITVFHDSLAPMITASPEIMSDEYGSDIFYSFTTEIMLQNAKDTIELYTYPDKQFSDGAFYGFSLENDNSGILYHSIGINGACYLHWGSRKTPIAQSRALNPSLIIVSMGANEAAGRNFIEEVFYREVHSFVSKLKEANPASAILLTAPAEAMRNSRQGVTPNPNYAKISATLAKYAKENNVAFFDMFTAMGGNNSSQNLNATGLLQRDKIHFTPEGYTLQGLLIYNALLNGYNKYVTATR